MPTIPDDLNQLARELEKIQEASKDYDQSKTYEALKKWSDLLISFEKNLLDDAIKIISDAEERIVMLEAREC